MRLAHPRSVLRVGGAEMIIDLETEVLRETTNIAKRANENIDQAVQMLNQVVIHDDWGCSERDEINNYTVENRRRVQELQSKAMAFYNALCESLTQFEAAEKETATSFQGVDGEIASVLSMTPGVITDTGPVASVLGDLPAGVVPTLCDFETISSSLNG